MSGDVVLLDRSTVAAVLEQVEAQPATSVADVRLRAELRRGLALSAAARAGAVLARDTRCPPASPWAEGVVGEPPFGDEHSTAEAARLLGVSPRTIRRRCALPVGHPDRLRHRVGPRGVFVVSGADVDACR